MKTRIPALIFFGLAITQLTLGDEHGHNHGPGKGHDEVKIGQESMGVDGVTYLNVGESAPFGAAMMKPKLTSKKQIHYGATMPIAAMAAGKVEFRKVQVEFSNLKKEFRITPERKNSGDLLVNWEVPDGESQDANMSVELVIESYDAGGIPLARLKVFTLNEGKYLIPSASLTTFAAGKVRVAVKKSKVILLDAPDHTTTAINFVTSAVADL